MSVLELVLVILLLAVLLGLVAVVIRRPTASGSKSDSAAVNI